VLLRLAVLLQRPRSAEPLPSMQLRAEERNLELRMPASWLDQHPLTVADLEQERDPLKDLGVRLQLRADESVALA
jgi:exopolyphosphatase/guanosine-5'-triphosphate,3'-diphosphate pyrophosphatase